MLFTNTESLWKQKQKCFLSYTGSNGKVASTSRGKGWTNEGIDAFNTNLKLVFEDRETRKCVFDEYFMIFCKEEQKRCFDSMNLQKNVKKRNFVFKNNTKYSPKKICIASFKIDDLRNDNDNSSDDSYGFI